MSVLATASVKHPSSTSNNIVLTNTGRVGIGTESPLTNLHVVGEVTLASQVRFGAGSVSTPSISTSGDTNTGLFFPAADTLALVEGGTEVLRITSDGRVGIGTTSPATRLEVDGIIRGRAADGEGGQIEFNNPDNASVGAHLDVFSADLTRWFTVRNNSQHQIGQLGGTGGIVTLHTAANERMRITAAGDVGIGTTTPGQKLEINGACRLKSGTGHLDIRHDGSNGSLVNNTGNLLLYADGNQNIILHTNNVQRLTIDGSGNVTIGNTLTAGTIVETSSKIFKENIEPIPDALNKILSLNGVIYHRKNSFIDQEAGLIAEEVAKVIPNLVLADSNGNPNGVMYSKITAYLIEAIKILNQELIELKLKVK